MYTILYSTYSGSQLLPDSLGAVCRCVVAVRLVLPIRRSTLPAAS